MVQCGMKLFTALLAFMIGFSAVPRVAKAQSLIVEVFPYAECGVAVSNQENIEALLKTHDGFLLTCPVDDRLMGDGFDSENCISRKFDYLESNPLTKASYPTVAINGRYVTTGAYDKIVKSGVKLAYSQKETMQISLKVDENRLLGELPAADQNRIYDLWVFAYKKTHNGIYQETIQPEHEHDEFGNHIDPSLDNNEEAHQPIVTDIEVPFSNVVTALKKLGDWDGRMESIVIPLHDFKAEGFAVVAQEVKGGPVVAFGYLDIQPEASN